MRSSLLLAGVLTLLLPLARSAHAVDHVSLHRDDKPVHVSGKVLVEAQDGGLLVMDSARVLWAVTPDELVRHEKDALPFESMDKGSMAQHLLNEMPRGFRIHATAHYVICYNTTEAYAEWCGALFERLYLAFNNYWRKRGLDLKDPEWPLVALVFDGKPSYSRYAEAELGEATSSIIGYYSLRTNRVTTYDLTGVDGQLGSRASTAVQINRILSRPEAERTVATIIHEATHQLAFNCGLQTRYADIPLWVSEGVAIYFETPDLRSSRGWRNIGGVNRVRLAEFRRYLRARPADSLLTLISNDERFRSSRTAPQAFAEAWALNYFLIRKHPDEYLEYMRGLSAKNQLLYDTPEERMAEFKQAFGDDLSRLEQEFLRYLRGVR